MSSATSPSGNYGGGEPRWTESQRAAIGHVGGDLLVSAAAGSGKTAVLAERCAQLVTMDGPERTTVDRLLVLTFTDAAASEMRTRIAAAIRRKAANGTDGGLARQLALVERASISTLHAFCGRVLRSYFHEAGVDPAFEIMDNDEAGLLRDEVISEVIARRHGLAAEDPAAAAFVELFEGYAQGRDGALAEFMRKLHAVLASVKDPAAWLSAARAVYAEDGIGATCDGYARLVGEDLARLAARCQRLGREARRAGAEVLAGPVEGFGETVGRAAGELAERGIAAWDDAGAAIRAWAWPARIATDAGVEDFAGLKERTVNAAKGEHRKLTAQTFAARQTAAQLAADLRRCAGPLGTLLELTGEFQERFSAAKRAQNQLDFADLERLTLELLTRADSATAADLKQRYDHILVDEFQDINPLQAALLGAARDGGKFGGRGNLFVVGDVKQSIYGFRLAEPRLFMELERGARRVTTHRAFVALQNNFRSRPSLLAAMNAVFSRLLTPEVAGVDYEDGHELRPPPGAEDARGVPAAAAAGAAAGGAAGVRFDGAPIELHVVLTDGRGGAEDEAGEDGETEDAPADGGAAGETVELSAAAQEAAFVARRIAELMAEGRTVCGKDGAVRPLAYRDIAILLRGVRNRAPLFVRALDQRGIPVHADLATGYFDAEEVRQTLALLNVLDNPLQDLPLTTALLSPYGRFSFDDLARVRLAYRDREAAFHEAVLRFAEERGGAARGGSPEEAELAGRLREFLARIDGYRARLRIVPLHEGLAEIYQEARMLVYVSGLAGAAQRVANLQALHHRARQFSGFRRQGLYRFLRFIERLREAEGDFGEAPVLSEASDVVRIMTIHKSKGLEFPVVFVAALGSKFNADRSGPVTVNRDRHVGLQLAEVERNVYLPTAASAAVAATARVAERAEELRLLYVAMTRAREHLVLTGTMREAAYERLRGAWAGHEGALPADAILRAGSFLECIVPVAGSRAGGEALAVATHVAGEEGAESGGAGATVRAAEPSESAAAEGAEAGEAAAERVVLEGAIARINGRYVYEALTEVRALRTVTELKKLAGGEAGGDEDASSPLVFDGEGDRGLAAPAFARGAERRGDDPLMRGTVMHRVLEDLDFLTVVDGAGVARHIEDMVARGRLTREEEGLVDRGQLEWFVGTELAERLRGLVRGGGEAAGGVSAGGARVLRELPFVYALPLKDAVELGVLAAEAAAGGVGADRGDWPQVRGTIDLLAVAAGLGGGGCVGAEIVDYKTDAASFVEAHLPAYRRQMLLYARAVEAGLGMAVARATLVFLAARQCRVIKRPAARG